MPTLKKRALRLAVIALIAYLGACLVLGVYLANSTLHPERMAIGSHGPDYVAAQDQYRSRIRNVAVRAADGAELHAWFVPGPHSSPSNAANAVILLHGLGDNREGVSGAFALFFLQQGYSILMPDARAHGESGGDLATFGVLEAGDVHRWVDWLEMQQARDGDPGGCIDELGVSMGAAIALEALRSEPRFCAVIAESPYASFREIAYVRIGQPWGIGPWLGKTLGRPIIEFGMLYARLRYGIDLDLASPEAAVAHAATPILLIHGLRDSNIPHYQSELIHAANPKIMLWEPSQAEHGSTITDDPEEYAQRVKDFLAAHSGESATRELAGAAH